MLQWGLADEGEETALYSYNGAVWVAVLQWGLADEGEETLDQRLDWLCDVVLQWGLADEGEETPARKRRPRRCASRFNGASPMKARKPAGTIATNARNVMLQWGLADEGEETPSTVLARWI